MCRGCGGTGFRHRGPKKYRSTAGNVGQPHALMLRSASKSYKSRKQREKDGIGLVEKQSKAVRIDLTKRFSDIVGKNYRKHRFHGALPRMPR